ncbi:PKD domain-containing protein [Massilia solisilvae]|uniref:PKD domain-containing protein n=1 Tax=Massilia solisilvae TaxID=1811225 RepID=A0ABT2BGJ9_9BURK|nr:PKD domain-containing protein [Massilia solisilvae]MCS0607641.1 PKD domain-containing protein [Massilia solisilvae]
MQRVQDKLEPAASATWPLFRLPVLLVALAAAGAAVAQQAQPYGTAESKTHPTHTTYRVINLYPAVTLASNPEINVKGQVSFSIGTGGGHSTTYVFDTRNVVNIGNLGGDEVVAVDLNDVGQVVGRATTASGVQHGFVWIGSAGIFDLSTIAGVGSSMATAINNHGVITGSYRYGGDRAFRWSPPTGLEDLGTLAVGGYSFGTALNDADEIAGGASTADNRLHAFVWTRSAGMEDIDTLNSVGSLPVAVGAKGEVAGNRFAFPSDFSERAFLWTRATGMVDIGSAGGSPIVLAMTPGLHMAGLINFVDRPQQAMSWTPATGTRNLGTLGGLGSVARGVNDRDQIVGFAQNKAGNPRAFIWTAQRGMRDLNKYLRHAPHGLVLDDAFAINDSGAIVASSNAGLVLLQPEQKCGCGHALGPVVAPPVVKTGMPLQASVAFTDEDRVGTRSVTWSWGDGSAAQAGQVRESDSAGSAAASHRFAAPGIYTVTATVVDRTGRSTAVSHDVVVTAPSGGTVAGAGTLMSPAGAFAQAPRYAGKASFRLIAPTDTTAKAERVPAMLQFDLPGLDFRSQDLRLLGRQGTQQVFEGSGTAGGAGGYKFRLSTSAAVPGGEQGSFILKIWHTDPTSRKDVVDYDNAHGASGTAAGRVTNGSIVLE